MRVHSFNVAHRQECNWLATIHCTLIARFRRCRRNLCTHRNERIASPIQNAWMHMCGNKNSNEYCERITWIICNAVKETHNAIRSVEKNRRTVCASNKSYARAQRHLAGFICFSWFACNWAGKSARTIEKTAISKASTYFSRSRNHSVMNLVDQLKAFSCAHARGKSTSHIQHIRQHDRCSWLCIGTTCVYNCIRECIVA